MKGGAIHLRGRWRLLDVGAPAVLVDGELVEVGGPAVSSSGWKREVVDDEHVDRGEAARSASCPGVVERLAEF